MGKAVRRHEADRNSGRNLACSSKQPPLTWSSRRQRSWDVLHISILGHTGGLTVIVQVLQGLSPLPHQELGSTVAADCHGEPHAAILITGIAASPQVIIMVAVITPPPLVKQTPRTYDSNGGHSSRPAVALPLLAPSPRHQTISTRGGTPLASIVITTTASIATTMLTGLPGPRAHLLSSAVPHLHWIVLYHE